MIGIMLKCCWSLFERRYELNPASLFPDSKSFPLGRTDLGPDDPTITDLLHRRPLFWRMSV